MPTKLKVAPKPLDLPAPVADGRINLSTYEGVLMTTEMVVEGVMNQEIDVERAKVVNSLLQTAAGVIKSRGDVAAKTGPVGIVGSVTPTGPYRE